MIGTQHTHAPFGNRLFNILLTLSCTFMAAGCARMGQPDGGWYDQVAPQVIGCSPKDKAVNVNEHKFHIYFSEYITLENATENVVVCPPQMETPDIKAQGKSILVNLKDTLKTNTTYTIDFSNAIKDNNEGNPLGNFTYTFSTGGVIDTLEVSGSVVDAETVEPVAGILVGLYDTEQDSAFIHEPMLRIAKTNDKGRFTIRGVAPGNYRIYSLQDIDGDYHYSQKGEKLAFSEDIVVPQVTDASRQDTIWKDALHIERIEQTSYKRYLPDNIVLRAFTAEQTDRYLIKSDRQNADRFTLYFSNGSTQLPKVKGLGFDTGKSLLAESTQKKDTITYWITDTTLVNTDSLQVELTYEMTDTTGILVEQTDTLLLLPKMLYERRLKEQQKVYEDWKKTQNKKKRRGEPYDTVMPPKPLQVQLLSKNMMAPDENVRFSFATPLKEQHIDYVHLYSKIDSLWYEAKFKIEPDTLLPRTYLLRAEWRPDVEYSLEIDSAAFTDIYGKATNKFKQGIKIKSDDSFGTLLVSIPEMAGTHIVCQLLDSKCAVKKQVITDNGQAEFFYLDPGTYYMNMIVDENGNNHWDTGCFEQNIQPEKVYFYPKEIECRAKWDMTLTWNPNSLPLDTQRPSVLNKQTKETRNNSSERNQERAKKLGIQYVQPKGY